MIWALDISLAHKVVTPPLHLRLLSLCSTTHDEQ
jgi:hypothetical protein